MSLFLFNLFFLFVANQVWAAACCGGGLSMPALIAGDDKAQMSISYGATQVVVDNVDSSGLWHRWDQGQKSQIMKLEGAHVFADRWQIGVSIPVQSRELGDQRSSGLGDISTSLNYEYLPDWDYNPYRPKGIGFLQINIPISKSRAESNLGGLDSRGQGLWCAGAGTLLAKFWGAWDVYSVLEWHRCREKNVKSSFFQGEIRPGSGRNISAGVGFSWLKYRLGLALADTQVDPVELVTRDFLLSTQQFQNYEQWSTFSVSLGILESEEWSYSVTFFDQTLVGEPINTSLGKGFTLQLQKRWLR